MNRRRTLEVEEGETKKTSWIEFSSFSCEVVSCADHSATLAGYSPHRCSGSADILWRHLNPRKTSLMLLNSSIIVWKALKNNWMLCIIQIIHQINQTVTCFILYYITAPGNRPVATLVCLVTILLALLQSTGAFREKNKKRLQTWYIQRVYMNVQLAKILAYLYSLQPSRDTALGFHVIRWSCERQEF